MPRCVTSDGVQLESELRRAAELRNRSRRSDLNVVYQPKTFDIMTFTVHIFIARPLHTLGLLYQLFPSQLTSAKAGLSSSKHFLHQLHAATFFFNARYQIASMHILQSRRRVERVSGHIHICPARKYRICRRYRSSDFVWFHHGISELFMTGQAAGQKKRART